MTDTGARRDSTPRTADLDALTEARARRRRLTEDLAQGLISFADVMGRTDSRFLRDTRLVKVLECRPGLGKVGARRLLVDFGLPERVTLGALTDETLRSLDAGRAEPRDGATPLEDGAAPLEDGVTRS